LAAGVNDADVSVCAPVVPFDADARDVVVIVTRYLISRRPSPG
jgi:hypothetical protein